MVIAITSLDYLLANQNAQSYDPLFWRRDTIDFPAADGGKNAHYLLRWVNSKGDKGPWSETASATVGT